MYFALTSVAPAMYIPWVLLSLICRLSLDKSRRSLRYEELKVDPLHSSNLQNVLWEILHQPLTSLFPNISPPGKWQVILC